MNIFRHRRIAGIVAVAALLSACGGGGGGGAGLWSSGPVVSGSAVKGPLDGATVCAFRLDNGVKSAELPVTAAPAVGGTGSVNGGCYVTGSDGRYAFSLPPGTVGDVLIESSGGRFCTDESMVSGGTCASGTLVALKPDDMLRAVVAVELAGTAQVHLTPLSTAAVGAAGQALSSASFAMQFGVLAAQLGVDPAKVSAATSPTAANQPYLAQAAQQMAAGAPLSTMVQGIQQGANPGGGGNGGAGMTSPATVHTALVGSHALRFYMGSGAGCGTSCDYTEGQDVPVEVFADGRLGLPGKTLSNPFYRSYSANGTPHLPEVIWLDPDTQVEYALSNNESGTFSEVNIGDASQPQGPFGTPRFLGQLRKAEAEGNTLLASMAGTYALAHQYYGADVAWSTITIGGDGAISFNGTGPTVTAAQVAEVVGQTACCSRIDVRVNFDLTADGVVDGSDKVSLFVDAAGLLQDVEYGTGSGNANRTGVRVTPAADLPMHGGSIAAPESRAIAAVVDGAAVSVNASQPNALLGTRTKVYMTASETDGANVLQKLWTVQVAVPEGMVEGGTYACRRGGSTTDTVIGFQPSASQTFSTGFGGRCSITITRLVLANGQVTEIGGTFVAEMGDFRHQLKVVRDGVFHLMQP